MKEGRGLVREAVEDAKSLKEVALEAAKRDLVESMAPGLKALLEKTIKGALKESSDRSQVPGQGSDYYPAASRKKQAKWEEAVDVQQGDSSMDNKKEKEFEGINMESIASFFPQLAEEPEGEEGEGMEEKAPPFGAPEEDMEEAQMPNFEASIPTLGEEEEEEEGEEGEECSPKKEGKGEEEGEMDEEIEISEAELKKVYESALQTEVSVKKGFGEMTKSGELDEVDPAGGIADFKKGEHSWEKETPPAKEDFTVKEMIKRGMAENKMLRENLKKAISMIKTLGGKLHETNLFNAKVLHVNRMLNKNARLTKEQKQVVLESIDKARSVKEVKSIYETLSGAFNAGQHLAEGKNPRKPTANAQRARTSGSPKPEVLRESVDRESNDGYTRMRKLAGLVK